MSHDIEQAMILAREVKKNSYSPYSQFAVGAVIAWKNSDELSAGCNVENSSFGATICAERNAIASHIARNGKDEIEFVLVMTDLETGAVPCGICLQSISQFASGDTKIYIANSQKVIMKKSLKDFLPLPFKEF